LTPCYPNINRFYPFGDSHSPSPNDEFPPDSSRLSLKTSLPNPGINLAQASSSQPAKRHLVLSAKFAAFGVLKRPARGSAEQTAIRWCAAICQPVDLCKELRQSEMDRRRFFNHDEY
jgi:hypothetical protein